jgi:propionate CoA-transferase
VNISQNTKKVFFVSTFTSEGLKEEVKNGRLIILQEGKHKKFLRHVQQITFSGAYGVQAGQDITFITERAVLKLTGDGLLLTELAPGMDLERDIFGQMEFRPKVASDLKLMDSRLFRAEKMGLTLLP